LPEQLTVSKRASTGARSRARDLAVQALYQQQITEHTVNELLAQFHERPDYESVDQDYFDEALGAICKDRDALEQRIDKYADRPLAQLDPVERAILLVGIYELESRAINEAVNLGKKFGAVDSHKYINALLDRAVAELRPTEAR
jgi:N utilization substance protein B